MKKKLAIILTSAVLATSLCACGKEETTTTAEPTTETITQTTADTNDTEDSDTPASNDDAQTSDEAFQAERGSVDENNVYTNRSFDISFKIDDNCTIYSDAEIIQLLGVGQDILQDSVGYTSEQLEAALSGTFYDVWFSYPDGMSNIYVAYENLDTMGASNVGEDMFILSMKQQFEAVTSLGYTFDDDTTETYAGQTYSCINAHTNRNMDQKVLLRKYKNYMICITISYPAGTTQIPDNFLSSITNAE